jgi:L-alanine-DL-glutamate epimerase-like enolase superfamily enzyme
VGKANRTPSYELAGGKSRDLVTLTAGLNAKSSSLSPGVVEEAVESHNSEGLHSKLSVTLGSKYTLRCSSWRLALVLSDSVHQFPPCMGEEAVEVM